MTILQAIGNDFLILIPDEQINPIDHGNCHEIHGVLISNGILSSHVSKIVFKELARADAPAVRSVPQDNYGLLHGN